MYTHYLELLKPDIPALTVYDYILTANSELRVVWGRPFRIPTFLFLVNRYTNFAFVLSIFLEAFVSWDLQTGTRVSSVV